SPFAPSVAANTCLNWKSPSEASSTSARSTRSPPRPPSPPSGPPRGTCASRRNEIAPLPPLPPRTITRARSRNMRDLRERADERADADVVQLLANPLERARDARRLTARHQLQRAQRVRVKVAQQERSALGEIARDLDERI